MGMEFLCLSVERLRRLDFDFGWEVDGAVGAVSLAVGAILFRIDRGEDVVGVGFEGS